MLIVGEDNMYMYIYMYKEKQRNEIYMGRENEDIIVGVRGRERKGSYYKMMILVEEMGRWC